MIIKCPNCNGALTYDVQSKKMVCEMCCTVFEPSRFTTQYDTDNHLPEQDISSEENFFLFFDFCYGKEVK